MSGALRIRKYFSRGSTIYWLDIKKLKEPTNFTPTTEDFIKYGMEPEFMGRVPVRVACSPLEHQDLVNILQLKDYSIIEQYKDSFVNYNIELMFTTSALKEIAKDLLTKNRCS